MMGVQGQFVVDITVNGNALPLQLGSFDHFAITENIMTFVPAMRAVIFDTSGVLSSTSDPVQDATPLTLALGCSQDDIQLPTAYNFRLWGLPKQVQIGGRVGYQLVGAYDAYKYWRSIPKLVCSGTSYQALQQIATDCGLTFDGVQTNDAMKWLITRKPYSAQAKFIADHGYIDDKSVMHLGLNTDGVLIYRDLSRLVKQTPKVTFLLGGSTSDGSIGVPIQGNYEMKTKSGLLNSIFKYGTRVVRENLDGSADTYDKTNVTLLSNNLDISSSVYGEVRNVRNEHAPPDMGNTHKNFRMAEHQNRQGQATFATTITLMTTSVAPVTLMDVVGLQLPATSDDNTSQIYNGKYIVAAKTRYVSGTQYYEKYALITQGPQIDENNALIG